MQTLSFVPGNLRGWSPDQVNENALLNISFFCCMTVVVVVFLIQTIFDGIHLAYSGLNLTITTRNKLNLQHIQHESEIWTFLEKSMQIPSFTRAVFISVSVEKEIGFALTT